MAEIYLPELLEDQSNSDLANKFKLRLQTNLGKNIDSNDLIEVLYKLLTTNCEQEKKNLSLRQLEQYVKAEEELRISKEKDQNENYLIYIEKMVKDIEILYQKNYICLLIKMSETNIPFSKVIVPDNDLLEKKILTKKKQIEQFAALNMTSSQFALHTSNLQIIGSQFNKQIDKVYNDELERSNERLTKFLIFYGKIIQDKKDYYSKLGALITHLLIQNVESYKHRKLTKNLDERLKALIPLYFQLVAPKNQEISKSEEIMMKTGFDSLSINFFKEQKDIQKMTEFHQMKDLSCLKKYLEYTQVFMVKALETDKLEIEPILKNLIISIFDVKALRTESDETIKFLNSYSNFYSQKSNQNFNDQIKLRIHQQILPLILNENSEQQLEYFLNFLPELPLIDPKIFQYTLPLNLIQNSELDFDLQIFAYDISIEYFLHKRNLDEDFCIPFSDFLDQKFRKRKQNQDFKNTYYIFKFVLALECLNINSSAEYLHIEPIDDENFEDLKNKFISSANDEYEKMITYLDGVAMTDMFVNSEGFEINLKKLKESLNFKKIRQSSVSQEQFRKKPTIILTAEQENEEITDGFSSDEEDDFHIENSGGKIQDFSQINQKEENLSQISYDSKEDDGGHSFTDNDQNLIENMTSSELNNQGYDLNFMNDSISIDDGDYFGENYLDEGNNRISKTKKRKTNLYKHLTKTPLNEWEFDVILSPDIAKSINKYNNMMDQFEEKNKTEFFYIQVVPKKTDCSKFFAK